MHHPRCEVHKLRQKVQRFRAVAHQFHRPFANCAGRGCSGHAQSLGNCSDHMKPRNSSVKACGLFDLDLEASATNEKS